MKNHCLTLACLHFFYYTFVTYCTMCIFLSDSLIAPQRQTRSFCHCMAEVSRCFSSLVIKDCNAVRSNYTGMYLNDITHVYLKRMQYYFVYSEQDRQKQFFFLLKGSIIQRVLCFFCFFLIYMCTASAFAVQPLWLLCSNTQSEKDAHINFFLLFSPSWLKNIFFARHVWEAIGFDIIHVTFNSCWLLSSTISFSFQFVNGVLYDRKKCMYV